MSLLLRVPLDHSITVAIDELVFTYLTRISSLNPKSRHYVTLATSRVVPIWRTKAIIYIKKSCPACQGYPTCRDETTHPYELSRLPKRVCHPSVNGWLNFAKK